MHCTDYYYYYYYYYLKSNALSDTITKQQLVVVA